MTTIYKNKEDGTLTLGFAGMDFDEYEVIEPEAAIKLFDDAPTWDYYDPEIWKAVCEEIGIDYDAYDDPDELFNDMKAKVETPPMYEIKGHWLGHDDEWVDTAEDDEQLVWVIDNQIKTNGAISDYTIYKDGEEIDRDEYLEIEAEVKGL